METAAKNIKELTAGTRPAHNQEGPEKPLGVLKVGPGVRCGSKEGHVATKCKFKDATCHSCGKQGHLKSVCRSKSKTSSYTKTKKRYPEKVGRVGGEVEESEEDSDEYPLCHMKTATPEGEWRWIISASQWNWTQVLPIHWCLRQPSKRCGQTASCHHHK